jgi:CheY-like chemotaxis protein
MKFNRVLSTLKLSHKVVEANNGEAIEILKVKEIVPDIIVLDLNMQRLTELNFLRILRLTII